MSNSIIFGIIGGITVLVLVFTDVIGFWGFLGCMILLIMIGGAWSGIEQDKKKRQKQQEQKDELYSLEGFKPSKKFVNAWGVLAIDDNSEEIAVKKANGKLKRYSYENILSCEIIENGETAYRKSNTIGRAVVGGVLAGGAGAIIGGLTGKSKEQKEVKSIDLKLVLKNEINDSFQIRFFDAKEATSGTKDKVKVNSSTYGPVVERAVNSINSWKDRLEAIIEKYDTEKEDNKEQQSVSDEIQKLHKLKEDGALTEDEFEQEKKKLLG